MSTPGRPPSGSDSGDRRSPFGAAGRWALYPARVAARASRGPIEAAADEHLVPEVSKLADRMLAGDLPEQLAGAMAEHQVIERMIAELAERGALDEAVDRALASPRTTELMDRLVASEAMQHAIRQAASSPEVRAAMREQSIGMWEELAGDLHARGVDLDARIGRRLPGPSAFAGLATRAVGFAVDVVLISILLGIASGLVALVSYLFGPFHPGWLAGALLGGGATLVAVLYLVVFWSGAGRTPGMHLIGIRLRDGSGTPPSVGRAIVRALFTVVSIAILFLGYLPVLLDGRRRGLPDLVAGTEVVYGPASAVQPPAAA